jgi:PAS domain S-box-containing protein
VFVRDITERKKAEEALAESEAFSSSLMVNSAIPMLVINHDTSIRYVNPAFEKLTGLTSAEVTGKTAPFSWWLEDNESGDVSELKNHAITGVQGLEKVFRKKNGERFWVEVTSAPVKSDGKLQYSLENWLDITGRKQAEKALRESEEKFSKAFHASPASISIRRLSDDKFIEVSERFLRDKGFTREEVIGHSSRELGIWMGDENHERLQQIIEERGSVHNELFQFRRKSGEVRDALISSELISLNNEPCVLVFATDITRQKQDEERINHLNLTLRSVRNINQLITREKNRDRLIKGVCNILVESRSCNNAWIALFDESRKLVAWAESGFRDDFSPMLELLNQGKLPPCAQKAMKQKRAVVTEDPPTMCTGCPIIPDIPDVGSMTTRLEYEGYVYGVISASLQKTLLSDKGQVALFKEVAADIAFALHDIALGAERDLLMQERLRAAKLESIGTLAGGIAHDFNNLLTGIMGNIGLAKRYLKPDDRTYEMVDEAEKAAVRARDLTQQLFTFARGGKPVKKLVKIAELVKESAPFALRGSNVRLKLSLPDDLWPVEADEGQISQVINNLVINADEAMPAGGILSIEAGNFTIKRAGALPLSTGNYVRIDIKDTGVGISEEHLQRIFEPYFTTKQKERGLGLPTSYSIIRNHGGYILAESVINEGTTFHIYLPASEKKVKTEKKSVVTPPGRVGGKVLVMDDEELIRKMLRNILELAGYETELTGNGAEALEKYAQALKSGEPFSAVIMDLTIPGGMGGKEAIKKLLEIDPGARVIVSSGYATDPIMSEYKKYGFSAVITKPYSVKQLEETLLGLSKRKKKSSS